MMHGTTNIKKMCVLNSSMTFVRNISRYKENLGETRLQMYIGLHIKYPLPLSDFNGPQIYWTDFRKRLKYQISWKSVQWEPSCSMWTDGRADRQDEDSGRFSKFCQCV